ncbi:MAG: hypothetical protein ACI9GM_001255 [Salibacteraceae bacterium]|jgi:hypothetical protein
MEDHFVAFILAKTKATSVGKIEVIQELWSGYGQITRIQLLGSAIPSVVVKYIDLESANSHPRGWDTAFAHERKIKSYEVELQWYASYSEGFSKYGIPKCIGILSQKNKHCLILEDLVIRGFPVRKTALKLQEVYVVLSWLAQFHGFYMNSKGNGLWDIGTYWHLDTRPEEWKEIATESIRKAAKPIDKKLNNAAYSTLVHGDAKLANFCFSTSGTEAAAVDFQYIGRGCGMKDVAYFLSSCLLENELESSEEELLAYYFLELSKSVKLFHPLIRVDALEKEWRDLYPFAWADFTRFLLGWMPTHQKLNAYSHDKMHQVLTLLNS